MRAAIQRMRQIHAIVLSRQKAFASGRRLSVDKSMPGFGKWESEDQMYRGGLLDLPMVRIEVRRCTLSPASTFRRGVAQIGGSTTLDTSNSRCGWLSRRVQKGDLPLIAQGTHSETILRCSSLYRELSTRQFCVNHPESNQRPAV